MSIAQAIRVARFDDLDDPGSRGFDPAGQGGDTLMIAVAMRSLHI
jgi:hypothetical protein